MNRDRLAPRDRMHWTAPAGSCLRFYQQLGVGDASGFLRWVGEACAGEFQVTGDAALLNSAEDDQRGGRADDEDRARDLTHALADDEVAAIVTVRGGAWLTRVLPRIDFSVLDRRRRPVALFGFSELTGLVNIIASHRMGRGILDMGPAFIPYGMRRFDPAWRGAGGSEGTTPPPEVLRAELARFLTDMISMLRGRGTARTLPVRVIAGGLPASPVRFIGGNLAVFTTLLASRFLHGILAPAPETRSFDRAADVDLVRDDATPAGDLPWLILEDLNEQPYRIDRLLAHLTLAGIWDRVGGLLLGDFHFEQSNLLDAVLALLPHHLPSRTTLPIVACGCIGHAWPMAPVPLNREGRFARAAGEWELRFDWSRWPDDRTQNASPPSARDHEP